jgi:hypothetical protein
MLGSSSASSSASLAKKRQTLAGMLRVRIKMLLVTLGAGGEESTKRTVMTISSRGWITSSIEHRHPTTYRID